MKRLPVKRPTLDERQTANTESDKKAKRLAAVAAHNAEFEMRELERKAKDESDRAHSVQATPPQGRNSGWVTLPPSVLPVPWAIRP